MSFPSLKIVAGRDVTTCRRLSKLWRSLVGEEARRQVGVAVVDLLLAPTVREEVQDKLDGDPGTGDVGLPLRIFGSRIIRSPHSMSTRYQTPTID